jgi:hypothetical protein
MEFRTRDYAMSNLDHPLRNALDDEIYSRPLLKVMGRATALHFAVYNADEYGVHRRLLDLRCTQLNNPRIPCEGLNNFYDAYGVAVEVGIEHRVFHFYVR